MDRNRTRHFLWSLAGLVVFANLFFFRAIGTFAVSIILLGCLLFLIGAFGGLSYLKKHRTSFLSLTAVGTVSAILISVRGNQFAQLVMLVTALVAGAILTYQILTDIPWVRSVTEILFIPFELFFSYLAALASRPLAHIINGSSRRAEWFRNTLSILLGLLIGLPVILILLGLFSGADPVFSETLKMIAAKITVTQLVWRVIFSVTLAVIAVPFVGMRIRKEFHSPTETIIPLIPQVTIATVMSMVAVVVAFFLAVQWQYIFVSVARETDLSSFGVATYSEYVQRGFIELLAASILLYSLLWIGLLSWIYRPAEKRTILPYIQTLVTAEYLVFLLSVARRIVLYRQYHGLSLIRIYGGLFLVYLFVMAIILLARHFIRADWTKAELAVTCISILIIGTFNAETLITRYPPTVNGHIDYVYLVRLSSDGMTGWIDAYSYAADVLTNRSLTAKPVLNLSDRTAIAYAGMIIGKLSSRYDHLIRWYASPREQSAYVTMLLRAEQIRVTEYRQRVQQAAHQTDHPDTASTASQLREPGADIATSQPDSEQLSKQNTLSQRLLQDIRIRLQTNTESETQNLSFIPSDTSAVTTYASTPCRNTSIGMWCMRDFYTPSNRTVRQLTGTDRLYVWNATDSTAYRFLRNKIPLTRLIQLQDAYLKMAQRIRQQNPEEQSISLDISLETPFLEQL